MPRRLLFVMPSITTDSCSLCASGAAAYSSVTTSMQAPFLHSDVVVDGICHPHAVMHDVDAFPAVVLRRKDAGVEIRLHRANTKHSVASLDKDEAGTSAEIRTI